MKTPREATQMSPVHRTVAIAALQQARAHHEHAVIRPKKANTALPRSAAHGQRYGVRIAPGPAGEKLDNALASANEIWPDENSWELLGADDYTDDDNGNGGGYFDDAAVYGEFLTDPDYPGWEG